MVMAIYPWKHFFIGITISVVWYFSKKYGCECISALQWCYIPVYLKLKMSLMLLKAAMYICLWYSCMHLCLGIGLSWEHGLKLKPVKQIHDCVLYDSNLISWIPSNLSFRYILFMKIDSKWCCDTTTPESIHTKHESKRDSAFAFIFGVNWPIQWM